MGDEHSTSSNAARSASSSSESGDALPDAERSDVETSRPEPPDAEPPDAEPPSVASGRPHGLRQLVLRAVVRNLPRRRSGAPGVDEPPREVGAYARWLPVLRAVPWLLGAVFAASFAWDFPGVRFTVAGHTVVVDGLLRVVSVSGLIGFLTNWLAITMLFQPREPRPLVGQGVIPAQRERVAWRLAQAVSDELINEEIIIEKIHESGLGARYRDLVLSVADDVVTDAAFRRELKAVLERRLRGVLASEPVQDRIVAFTAEQLTRHAGGGLPGLALRTYRTLNEDDFQQRLRDAVARLPESVGPVLDEIDPLLDRAPEVLRERAGDVEDLITQLVLRFVENLDVQRIVLDNVQAYDERQLEALLKRTTNEQLNYIKYLGGVLGVVGGLVIWEPVASLVALTLVGLGVYALDEALFRASSNDAA